MITTILSTSPTPSRSASNCQFRDSIAISIDTKPTPVVLRSLRIKANLTKADAAHIVGLNGRSASWHQYELGRYSIPDEKWLAFIRTLSSGRYPATCFVGPRRGTRIREDFEVGRLSAPVKSPQNVDMQACADFTEIRGLLRLSAAELARELGIQTYRIYRIEGAKVSPSPSEMAQCTVFAKAQLAIMQNMAPLLSLSLSNIRKLVLRISCAEAAKLAKLGSKRPSGTWAAIETGRREDAKATSRFRRAAELALHQEIQRLTALAQT